jgi:hypothetical protein
VELDLAAPDLPDGLVLDPIVRIARIDVQGGREPGSGFLIDAWPHVVITARHVLTSGAEPRSVTLTALTAGGPVTFGARACAYPGAPGTPFDCAVLWLGADVAGLARSLADADVPEEDFQAILRGWPEGGHEYREVGIRARPDGAVLDYVKVQGSTAHGMSGGPLEVAAGVVGIHHGSDGARCRSSTLCFELLNPCADAAWAVTAP